MLWHDADFWHAYTLRLIARQAFYAHSLMVLQDASERIQAAFAAMLVPLRQVAESMTALANAFPRSQ